MSLAMMKLIFILQVVFLIQAVDSISLSSFFPETHQSALKYTLHSTKDAHERDNNRWSVDDLLVSMAKIDSEVGYEYEVVHWLRDVLEKQGLTVELQLVEDAEQSKTGISRHNLYAYMGKERNTKILLSAHLDTNPEGHIPYHKIGEEIHVRGGCDAKGSVAGQITAFLQLWDENKIDEGDVALLFVIGEEYNGVGMKTAIESLNATWSNAAILGEPTENKLSKGHKGNFRFDIEAWGKKSHSGYPELGFSAIEFLVRKLNILLDAKLPTSDLLGPTTVNIGTIKGGDSANIIPSYVKAQMYIRVAMNGTEIKTYVENLFNTEHSKMSVVQFLDPQYLSYDVPGFDLIACSYATDMPYLKSLNLKKYLYGPGSITVAHTQAEFVTISDLYDSVIGYKKIIEFNL